MERRKRVKILRNAACIALTAVFSASVIVSSVFLKNNSGSLTANADGSYSLSYSEANGSVDLTDVRLSNLSSSVIESLEEEYGSTTHTAIVSLDGDSVLDGGKEEDIENEQESFLEALQNAGISYELKYSYSTVLNAVAIEVPFTSVSTIKAMSGVKTVSLSSSYAEPESEEDSSSGSVTQNSSNIYKTGIYDSSSYLSKADGSGMTVAIIDTGLDYTHEAFSENQLEEDHLNAIKNDTSGVEGKTSTGYFTHTYIENKVSDKEEVLNAVKRTGATADDLYVSAKVPFAYDYADNDADVYPSYSNHGTHVAGIVAGESDSYADKDGNAVNEKFSGVAPEAQLVICKVFTDDLDSNDLGSAVTEDILAALEDCVTLGVDIINMSLGTTSGFTSSALGLGDEDTEGTLMKKVYSGIEEAGISLIVAASNDYSAGYGSEYGTNLATNPDSGTVGSPSTYDGALSVASVNGQYASYIMADPTYGSDGKPTSGTGTAIYFEESRNEDSEAYDFVAQMLALLGDGATEGKFTYIVIPGTGENANYNTNKIQNAIKAAQSSGEKIIAVVKRGSSTFAEKIKVAKEQGMDGIIVYNNVSGMIRMSLQDLEDPIPAISISQEAGEALEANGSGTLYISTAYSDAGPFMNDYSSWGTTADLNIKPDVTAHGGEILSTVAGGYEEMSGTSMATPNLAGFTALLRSYLKNTTNTYLYDSSTASIKTLAYLTNNIMMSTATMLYDQNGLPYSPRKQGSGLATMANAFNTSAYLYTMESEGTRSDNGETMYPDGRPKAELGADTSKTGVYTMKFHVKNFGSTALTFKANSIVMTETLGADGVSVAEKAYIFTDTTNVWKVDGNTIMEGNPITVAAGGECVIEVTITLSSADKNYIETNFANGMFVEGYLQLLSTTDGQCDLNFPFLSYYGDWDSLTMLDYDCFEIAEFDKNTSYTDNDRPKAVVWATQAYSYYYNEKYATPLGSFLYTQDEDKEHTTEYIYTDEDHIAISRFNNYTYASSSDNYMTVTGIRALYAGLLRNAELVTCTVTNVDTGEVILTKEVYRVSKAYAGGGSAAPGVVPLELRTDELDVVGNGKYQMDFAFYFDYQDYEDGVEVDEENTFSMTFYVDYEAPILTDSRIRFQDVKDENGNTSQKVYLDLDVYDNHYPQAVLLCYGENGEDGNIEKIQLATEYVTPVLNAVKNGTTTVSIEITDLYEEYKGNLYVEVDDYAMNHNVYVIDTLNYAQGALIPSDWTVEASSYSVAVNSAVKASLGNLENANLSCFTWESLNPSVATVKNGEIFGVSAGTTKIAVTGAGRTEILNVTVTESAGKLTLSSLSFTTMLNDENTVVSASGTVKVNPAQQFTLSISCDPWYFPLEDLTFEWSSSNTEYATVDQNGNVTVLYEDTERIKTITITAQCTTAGYTSRSASVTLSIQDPYTVSSTSLTKYRGWGGTPLADGETYTLGGITYQNTDEYTVRVLTVPSDKTITTISSEAFKEVLVTPEGSDKKYKYIVILPKAVTTIGERAFEDCKDLLAIGFVSNEQQEVRSSKLSIINEDAFTGCTGLETVDLTNCKVITVARDAFAGCTALKNIVAMTAIGTAYDQAFMDCVSLDNIDLTKLHVAGTAVFAGCTSLKNVTTGENTALGVYMFSGCTSLEEIEINCSDIPTYAFAAASVYDNDGELHTFKACTALNSVAFNGADTAIGACAFYGCTALNSVTFGSGCTIKSVASYAFAGCESLPTATISAMQAAFKSAELGGCVFDGTDGGSELIVGDTLVYAAATVDSESYLTNLVKKGVTKIGAYAFSDSRLSGVTTLDLTGVTSIGEGAFYSLTGLKTITIPENITAIADYAFARTGLTSIDLSQVTSIGDNAFAGCSSLKAVTLTANVNIGEQAFGESGIQGELTLLAGAVVGDYAFYGCTGITKITATADGIEIGDYAFYGCTKIAEANLSGVKKLGDYAFAVDSDDESSLTTVALSDTINEIGSGAFQSCAALTGIDFKNVEIIGDYAFEDCENLATLTGIEKVKEFGNYSFKGCAAITSLTLTAATKITARAFAGCESLTSVTFGENLQAIGQEAFTNCPVASVTIPASCTVIGAMAFTASSAFTGYDVDENNEYYFDDDGVLYRYIDRDSGKYELVSYPLGRVAETVDGVVTYTVLDGTVSTEAYAFIGIPATSVSTVVFPYTLKGIGSGAFYGSGVTTFKFNSITAPTILEQYTGKTIEDNYSMNSFFYQTFGDTADYLTDHAPHIPGGDYEESSLVIYYPSNGTGYTNFVYTYYFGKTVSLGELPEDDTRELKSILESLADAETVATWTTSTKTKAEVEEYSEQVKEAHRLYNNLATTYQTEYVGEGNINKLFAIEAALKSVKSDFGISVSILSVGVDSSSTHKKTYAVGEKFSMSGLKVLVTYDDYSTEVIDATGNFELDSDYDRELRDTDTRVRLDGVGEYSGKTLRLTISVTEEGDGGASGVSGCGSVDAGDGTIIGISLTAILLCVFVMAKRRRYGGCNY